MLQGKCGHASLGSSGEEFYIVNLPKHQIGVKESTFASSSGTYDVFAGRSLNSVQFECTPSGNANPIKAGLAKEEGLCL